VDFQEKSDFFSVPAIMTPSLACQRIRHRAAIIADASHVLRDGRTRQRELRGDAAAASSATAATTAMPGGKRNIYALEKNYKIQGNNMIQQPMTSYLMRISRILSVPG